MRERTKLQVIMSDSLQPKYLSSYEKLRKLELSVITAEIIAVGSDFSGILPGRLQEFF